MKEPIKTAEVVTPEQPIAEKEIVSEGKPKVGLSAMVDRYRERGQAEVEKVVEPTEPTKAEVPTKPAYSYEMFKHITDKDYKDIDDLLQEQNIKSDAVRHKLAERIDDWKKYQKLSEVRLGELNQLKTKLPLTEEEKSKYQTFIDELKRNPADTLKKYKDEFGLPDPTFIAKQVAEGGINSKIELWQSSTLTPAIEQKYKLEQGDFVFDPSDAYKAGTPSYDFRVETEKYEKTLYGEYEAMAQKERESLEFVTKQRDSDLTYLFQTHFGDNEEEYKQYLAGLDTIYDKLRQGEMVEDNPFSVKTIFRGVYFDKLADKLIKQATEKVHAEYAKRGMYIPKGEQVTDVTKVKGTSPIPATRDTKGMSPLNRSISRLNN